MWGNNPTWWPIVLYHTMFSINHLIISISVFYFCFLHTVTVFSQSTYYCSDNELILEFPLVLFALSVGICVSDTSPSVNMGGEEFLLFKTMEIHSSENYYLWNAASTNLYNSVNVMFVFLLFLWSFSLLLFFLNVSWWLDIWHFKIPATKL